ncbi:hypothetical protein PR048_003921 [Dryococelus australis]|uniref:Uncharacterized protein n=1 Tax=Dryococelus australis TaxID=614101 RepID=A0ABQ9IPC4_9NEOP|nr:hypothetical protein PR048_003921 [Dryococelus australis]
MAAVRTYQDGGESGTAVAEWFDCSPPTKSNLVWIPGGPLPDLHTWESGVFSGISRFPLPCIPAPLPYLNLPSSTSKTSFFLRATQISQLRDGKRSTRGCLEVRHVGGLCRLVVSGVLKKSTAPSLVLPPTPSGAPTCPWGPGTIWLHCSPLTKANQVRFPAGQSLKRVSSGIFRFAGPCIPALRHTHLASHPPIGSQELHRAVLEAGWLDESHPCNGVVNKGASWRQLTSTSSSLAARLQRGFGGASCCDILTLRPATASPPGHSIVRSSIRCLHCTGISCDTSAVGGEPGTLPAGLDRRHVSITSLEVRVVSRPILRATGLAVLAARLPTSTTWRVLPQQRYDITSRYHVGCPAHFSRRAQLVTDMLFPRRWIRRMDPVVWPPRSPDLATNGFLLWGRFKDIVY